MYNKSFVKQSTELIYYCIPDFAKELFLFILANTNYFQHFFLPKIFVTENIE